jgi:hypothetical protein
MKKKRYLISHKPEKFQALNSGGITHILKIKTIKFFGLIKTIHEQSYIIPERANYTAYINHWDKLIETGKSF